MASVLVIDDEQSITTALSQILESAGHQVVVAPNGKIGMELFDVRPIDLVITDILMPEQDGVETVMKLRRQSPDVKILAMSGGGRYGFVHFLDVAKKLGADSTIYKPFTKHQILDAVNQLLES